MADILFEYDCRTCRTPVEVRIPEQEATPDCVVECGTCGASEELGNLWEYEALSKDDVKDAK